MGSIIGPGDTLTPVYSNFDFEDPNDPNSTSCDPDVNFNIPCDPEFVIPRTDPNGIYDLHLKPDSPLKDQGDSLPVGLSEKDIDGNDRIFDNEVEMGADEITCDDVTSV